MNRSRIRNLVHWKIMILLSIVIWIGISKVAASSDPSEVEEYGNDSPLQLAEEVIPHKHHL
ncbi:hypothetical protein [Pontibacillus marinus]|uniref:Uncharacterized protein n=1 Tax=Pontibacillus marinus BH030004 = DSM 16465 TaxID=1385511 RepID=A0A0A5FTA5_9BACI|nr:hypothetical protein [Pontibacillus marinus]KGX83124.1 hypothetical protein N783_06415 [Pontibacillus marinus BH030004 = DSM 16465]